MTKENLQKEYATGAYWGLSTNVDLYDCNPDFIRDAKKIKEYVYELCEFIKMKRFGECTVVNFGADEKVAGFSMTQLIETSLISGHFANITNNAYLDVFSCSFYSPDEVAEFSRKFFQAKKVQMNYTLRK